MPKPAKCRPKGGLPPSALPINTGGDEPDIRGATLSCSLGGMSGLGIHRQEIVRTAMNHDQSTGRGFDSRRLQAVDMPLLRGEKNIYIFQPPPNETVGQGTTPMLSLLADSTKLNALSASPRQVAHNANCVKRFMEAQGISAPQEISRLAVKQYLTDLLEGGLSPKTIRNHLAAISQFCMYLVDDREILPANPCLRLPCSKIEKLPPLFLDAAECARALKIARDHHIYGEVYLAMNTGLRLAELRNLRWEDIDWSDPAVLVRKSKSKRFRKVPLNHKALVALRYQRFRFGRCPHVFPGGNPNPCCNPRHWARKGPRKMEWWTTKSLKPLRAKIAKFSQMPPGSVGRGWHLFRHTFATKAVRAKVSILQVSKWMGHAHVTTTEIYAHMGSVYTDEIEKI